MKYHLSFLLAIFSGTSSAGELLYSKLFTATQEAQVQKCFKLDSFFNSKVNALTESGDIALTGMIMQKNGPMFLTKTNAYGSWMDYKPLNCDFRSQEEQKADIKREKELHSKRVAREKERDQLQNGIKLCAHSFKEYMNTKLQNGAKVSSFNQIKLDSQYPNGYHVQVRYLQLTGKGGVQPYYDRIIHCDSTFQLTGADSAVQYSGQ